MHVAETAAKLRFANKCPPAPPLNLRRDTHIYSFFPNIMRYQNGRGLELQGGCGGYLKIEQATIPRKIDVCIRTSLWKEIFVGIYSINSGFFLRGLIFFLYIFLTNTLNKKGKNIIDFGLSNLER